RMFTLAHFPRQARVSRQPRGSLSRRRLRDARRLKSALRASIEIPLEQIGTEVDERVAFGLGLDAFAHDLGSELRGAHVDHGSHDALLAWRGIDAADERHVELGDVGLELPEAR